MNACYAADTEHGPVLVLSPHQSPAAAASAAAQALGDVRWDVVQALVAPHFPGWRFEDLISEPSPPHPQHGFPGWLSDRFEKDLSRSRWAGWGYVLAMMLTLAAAVGVSWWYF